MRSAAALTLLAVLAGIAAGCGGGGSGSSTSTGSKTTSASSCTKKQLKLVTANTLTIGTGNPAYAPWYEGGEKLGANLGWSDGEGRLGSHES